MSRVALRVVAVLVAIVTGAAGLAFSGGSASAAPLDRPDYTRSVSPPGTGYKYGVPRAELGACDWSANFDDRGGWSGTRYVTKWVNGGTYQIRRPFLVQWDDPCYYAEGTGTGRIRVPTKLYAMEVAATPESQSARMLAYFRQPTSGPAAALPEPEIVCASSEWSATQTRYSNPSAIGSLTWTGPSSTGAGTIEPQLGYSMYLHNTSACTHVVSFRFIMCGYDDPGSGTSGDEYCDSFVWSADAWYTGSQIYPDVDPDVMLCRAGAYTSACNEIDPPDRWTWDQACAYPPGYGSGPPAAGGWDEQWSWVFTTWFPFLWELVNDLIAHYVECSFVPPGGWDYDGRVPAAWGSSSFTHAFGFIEDAGAAFTFTESCGVVADLPPILASAPIDTCAWAEWAGPVKSFITWTAWIAFGFWAIWFVVQTMLATIRMVPMPNPLTLDVAEARAAEQIGS